MIKTLFIVIIGVLFSAITKAQQASALWELSSTTATSVSVSGNVVGQDESFSEMAIYNYTGPNNSQRVTTLTGSWPAETEQNENRYIQFAVSPNAGYNFTVTSIMMDLGASGGSNMRANIWYSKDPVFAEATQLNASVLVLPNGSFLIPSPNYSLSETVIDGETFYLRIYPWYTSSSTGKYVCPQNVLISGSSVSSSAIFPSATSLDLGITVAGSISPSVGYSVYGTNLSENVVVKSPQYFEISLDNITFSDSIVLPLSGGSLPLTTIYVHFYPDLPSGTINGIITQSSGSISADLSVTGIAIANEPTISSIVTFDEVTGNSITVNFSGGNGSNRIVVVKSENAVDWEPVDGSSINGVNNDFNLAADQGNGNKAVYDGTGSIVNVTGLIGNTTYYFSVYEYNIGTNNSQNYFTSSAGTGIQTTLDAPAILVTPSILSFGNVSVNSYSDEQTYTLSANTLTPSSGNISVTAPSGFEISTTSGTGFSSSLDIPYSGGELNSTIIYVRFFPTSVSFYDDLIINSGANAEPTNVSVTGNGIAGSQNVFEAEDCLLFGSYVRTQYAGYSGSGYVDMADRTGSYMEFVFRRSEAATDTITIYFANGASSRTLSVSLNDVVISSLSFSNTGSWTNWSFVKTVVPLTSGINRLRFSSTTNGSNPNIDKIFVGGIEAFPLYKLILESSGGTVSATPLQTFYDAGTQVTLTANPSTGNTFFRWGGTENNFSNPYIVTMNSHKTAIGIMMDTTGFSSFPYESLSKGFSSVNSLGFTNGTTGGSGPEASFVFITSSTELVDLMYQRVDTDHLRNSPPLTVYIVGTLVQDPGVSNMIDVKDAYDISIIGVGSDATFSGVGLKIVRSSNIIIRNILFMNSSDDGISVQAEDDETTGNHIWIDHCSITNCYDGALDVTHTPSYVTISWNHFYNHDKTCLMGHSDSQVSDTAMKVTYHHNFFDQTRQRHPRIRFGKAHMFNNYYLGSPTTIYGVSSNLNAQALVEGCYFDNVPIPTETSRDGSPPGNLVEQNNIFINCGTPGTGGTVFDPHDFYSYSVDSPNDVPEKLIELSGSGKFDFSLGDSLNFPLLPEELISFDATTISSTHIDLSFTPNGNNDNVVIVWNNSGVFTIPTGTPPSIGNSFAGGTLLYNGIVSPFSHNGLTPSTDYFYKAFSYNGNYSSGLTSNATTQNTTTTFQLSVSVSNGWNMVSIPGVNPDGQDVGTWWPGMAGGSSVYKFISGAGYTPVTAATPGQGYWLKNDSAQVYNTGDEWPVDGIQIVPHDPLTAGAGWNLIGGYENITATENLTTTPPGLINGPVYGYSGGYVTSSDLLPGYGYWIKLSAPGEINISGALAKSGKKDAEFFKENWGRIIITDASNKSYTLYAVKENLSENGTSVDLKSYELPPLPPTGMFDIRFGSGRIAENINSEVQYIEMRGITYPVKVKANNIDINLKDLTGKEINANIKSGEEITINIPNIDKLMISAQLIPDEYALEQNYPNPFNPSTMITFKLAAGGMTRLIVYNLLGEKVETLVEEVLPAGTHRVRFDASKLSSGVYFYRIDSGKYSGVKKMMILK